MTNEMGMHMQAPKRSALGQELKNAALILLGATLTALSFNLFFVPNKIAPGGLTGLSTILHHLFGLPVGVMTALMNIPLFLLSWRQLGKRFALRSLIAMLLLSLLLDILPDAQLTGDMLLNAVIGGAMLGAGLGLVVLGNATTGGTDMAAAMVQALLPQLRFGTILLLIESIVVGISALAFGAEVTLYAVVALFISSKMIDTMQAGVSEGRLFFVVSDQPEALASALMEELSRGVTILSGHGAYTGNERPVLFCVVRRNQVHPFKRIVATVDPRAFVVLANVSETMGEGFAQIPPPK